MQYDVSIIIPVYCRTNESLEWLNECIESACKQDCEVVVYDDGSPIDISNIVHSSDVDIFVRSNTNIGVSHARNMAIHYASKSLVFPLDCDDRLVDDAIHTMYKLWEGIPIYPDVRKFGDEDVRHYALLNFDCSHLYKYVGFTSVNVLHSKSQHIAVGGYDESLKFYEDGEYNARLLGTYCGIRYPQPLVEYRMHSNQRTIQFKSESRSIANSLLERIRNYDMACCGKNRKTVSTLIGGQQSMFDQVELQNSQIANMPLEFEGKVLARYVGGKGKARHYYNGPATHIKYKVMFGNIIYVDPRDAKSPDDVSSVSSFVRIIRESQPQTPPVKKPVNTPDKVKVGGVEVSVERSPKTFTVDKIPATEETVELPDISNMSLRDIRNAEFSAEVAAKLLEIEKNGHNRSKVVSILENRL